MEAVPRMPMLSFELKQSLEFVEYGPTLKQYIRDHYGEDPAHYNKACTELEQLRQSAVHISHDFMGCSTLKKYFAQLQFLQGRFPMSEMGEAAIPFTWEDVYSGREVTVSDIKFEQACILYNIGSLHSILGAMDTRQSADGMKVSCTHFQCAAWAFEYLRDHFGCGGLSLDMTHELLTFQSYIMLAQAQECILEKSMTDSRKSTITAKVSAQIVEFYQSALRHLETCNSQELISSKQNKDWKKRADLKILFYTCITNYYLGKQAEDQQKWGLSLAHFTVCLNKLNECQKLAKNESHDIQESLKFMNDVIVGKHTASKKDNDFVYHDKVPELDSLPEVKGASLVKGLPFNPSDPEISGPDIFLKLVPMSAHEASSMYSEEKATLLRRIASEIAEKNEELSKYMLSLQLDTTKLKSEPERLPQQLLEKCAALSVRPNAIKDLVDSMAAVSNVSTEVDLGIKEIQQLMQDESAAELEYQETFGKHPPNAILSEVAKECARLEEGHKKGSQSNTDLHKAMNTHISNLKLLSSPLEDLQHLLPSLDKDKDPESDDVIKQLNALLEKIEEMKAQREGLEEQLRKDIHNDDITGVLCKQEGANREALFSEQLKKHEKVTSLIRQNLSAQVNILRAMTDANASYAKVRQATGETILRRDQMIRDLINSYDVYEDLMAKSQKGLEFYKKLETNVGRLLNTCKRVIKIQQEERENMMNRYKPKGPAPARPASSKPSIAVSMTTSPGTDPQGSPGIVGPLAGGTAVPVPGPAAMTGVFDGPKLKDYLPFMKPKTFGKKDGSPPISSAHPSVQDYLGQGGSSLPNSGTVSPVHLPQMPGSVPASPDHFRHKLQARLGPMAQTGGHTGPDLTQGHPQYPSLPSTPDGHVQGQVPQGYPRLRDQESPAHPGLTSLSQQVPVPNTSQYVQGEFDLQKGQVPQGEPQRGQGPKVNAPTSQYVPLDQQWKRGPPAGVMSRPGGQPANSIPHGAQGSFPGQVQSPGVPAAGMTPQGQGHQVPVMPAGSREGSMSPMAPSPQLQQQVMGQPGLAASQQLPPSQPQPVQGPGHHVTPQAPQGHMQREVTNTVSAVGTPVFSPGDGHHAHGMHDPTFQGVGAGQYQGQVQIYQQGQYPTSSSGQMIRQSQSSQLPSTNLGPQQQYRPHTRGGQPPQNAALSGQQMYDTQDGCGVPSQAQTVPSHYYQPQQQHPPQLQQQVPPQNVQPYGGPAVQYQQPNVTDQLASKSSLPQTSAGQVTGGRGFQQQQQQHTQQQQLPQHQQQQPLPQHHQQQPLHQQQQLPQQQQQFHASVRGQMPLPEDQPGGQQHMQYPQGMSQSLSQMSPASMNIPQSQTFTQGGHQHQLGSQQSQLQSQPQQPLLQNQPHHYQQVTSGVQASQPHLAQVQQVQPQQQYQGAQSQYPSSTHSSLPQGYIPHSSATQFQTEQQMPGSVTTSVPSSMHQLVQSQQQARFQQPLSSQPQQQQNQLRFQHPPLSQQNIPQLPVQQQQGFASPAHQQSIPIQTQYPQGQQQLVAQRFTAPVSSAPQQYSAANQPLPQQSQASLGQFAQQNPGQNVYTQGKLGNPQNPPNFQQSQTQGVQGQNYIPVSQGQGQPFQGHGNLQPYQNQGQITQGQPQQYGGHAQQMSQSHVQPPLKNQQSQVSAVPASSSVSMHQWSQQGQMTAQNVVPHQGMPQVTSAISQTGFQQGQPLFQGQTQLQHQNQSQAIIQGQTGSPLHQTKSGLMPQNQFSTQQTMGQTSFVQGQVPGSFSASVLQPQVLQPTSTVSQPSVPETPPQAKLPPPGESQGHQGVTDLGQQGQFHPASKPPLIGQKGSSFDCLEVRSPVTPDKGFVADETKAGPGEGHHREPQVPVTMATSHRQIPVDRQLSTASSLDEILSSSPDARGQQTDTVLAPKVLTAQEIQQQKEDQLKNSSMASFVPPKDPYFEQSKRDKFVQEVEKLAKLIEGLEKPLCSGPTPLDMAWKEIIEEQEKAGRKQKLAIARCYPMKNRDQDVMPYDDSRVLLTTLSDDYINASWVNDLSPLCPKFIATQAPLPHTLVDFWLMIYEQGVEVLVMLSSENETGKKFPVYIPVEKGEIVDHGPIRLTVQSVKQKACWTERILHLRHSETKTGRTLVHLLYNCWPVSGFPEKISHMLQFITEVHSFYRQQRSLLKPIVVHCSNGVGRTGMFLMTYVGMQVVNHGDGIINVAEVAGNMLWKRRNLLLRKDQLKFCYEALLYFTQDVLAKQGILVHKASFGDELPKPGVKSQSWEPGEDILFGSMSLSNLQTNIAKMTAKRSDSAKLDKKLEMLKNEINTSSGENSEGNSLTGALIEAGEATKSDTLSKCEKTVSDNSPTDQNSVLGSSLPDVVQGPGLMHEGLKDTLSDLHSDMDMLSGLGSPKREVKGQGHTDDLEKMKLSEDKGSSCSLVSLESDKVEKWKPMSLNNSPAHRSREGTASPQFGKTSGKSMSLAELQDPNTFSIGTGTKTRKITRADFTEEREAQQPDPDDPLGSLDPFWSLK